MLLRRNCDVKLNTSTIKVGLFNGDSRSVIHFSMYIYVLAGVAPGSLYPRPDTQELPALIYSDRLLRELYIHSIGHMNNFGCLEKYFAQQGNVKTYNSCK